MVVPMILVEAEGPKVAAALPANERGPTDCEGEGKGMSEITWRDAMVAAGAVGAVALGLSAAPAKDPEEIGERKSPMTKHENDRQNPGRQDRQGSHLGGDRRGGRVVGDRIVITMNGKFLPYKKW